VSEEQDDFTRVYMYGFKNGEQSMKAEIERLRAEIAHDRDQRLAAVVAVVRQCEITLSLPYWFEDKIRAALEGERTND